MPKTLFRDKYRAKVLLWAIICLSIGLLTTLPHFFSYSPEVIAEIESVSCPAVNSTSLDANIIGIQSEQADSSADTTTSSSATSTSSQSTPSSSIVSSSPVYVVPVKGVIDLGLSGFIKRSLQEVKEKEARAVIFEIDTFGGRVDAATDICEYIEDLPDIPRIAFVDDQAWSAGALIALACQKIIMSEGSTIGSAEPRISIGLTQEETDEKTVSAIRAKFRAIAEQNGHSPNLAAAMVDKDIVLKKVTIDGQTFILTPDEIKTKKTELGEKDVIEGETVIDAGKLLNLSAKEAKELGLASDLISSRQELLKLMGWPEEAVVEISMSWSEVLVRFLTHPVVSPMLLSLGFLGLLFELRMPGWGISGTLGLIFLALFFWGHYLIGLANWVDMVLFLAGAVLLALEIFVIPGFGLAGISGIILLITGLFMALVKHPLHAPKFELISAARTISVALFITLVGAVLLFWFAPHTFLFKRLVLASNESRSEGYQAANDKWRQYLNCTGQTLTILRPAGRAVFGDEILDVVTQGEFIDKDKPVKIVKIEGNRIVVTEWN